VLNLVPFAGTGRKMTNRQAQAGSIRQFLQLELPQSQPPAIAAPAVSRNQ
jgi:hypothetical protein